LDFFSQDESRFKVAIKNIKQVLKTEFKIIVDTQSKDFVRLKTFPIELLDNINLIDKDFLNNFEDEFKIIIDEINQKMIHKVKM